MTESKLNGPTNWRTISVFLGIVLALVTVVNVVMGRIPVGEPDHGELVTQAEYKAHVHWADERYKMMCKRLDEIAETQREILKEVRANP